MIVFYGLYFYLKFITQRGVTKKFLENIIKSNKKIISLSPLAGGKLEEIFLILILTLESNRSNNERK